MKHTFDVATEAAKAALEPEPLKPDEEPVFNPGPEPVSADLMTPMPPMIAVVKKKRRVANKLAAKKAAKKAPAKAAKKSKQAKASTKKTPKTGSKKSTKKTAKKAKTPARTHSK
jgi:hypothetical protein